MLIYCATNTVTGRQYVGLTTCTLDSRIYGHKRDALVHPNTKFYRAINKYNFENFEFSVLEDNVADVDTLKKREAHWIKELDTYKNGYNSTFGGEDAPMWHKEARDKVSTAMTGRIVSEETRRRLSVAHTGLEGTPHTTEHKKYMSQILTGRKKSPEHVEKMRLASSGKKQSKETVEKRMKHIRGVKKSAEHTAKLKENFRINGFTASGKDHPMSKQVKQIDLTTGEVLAVFDTISDASESLGKPRNGGCISRCINGKSKTAYGYGWISCSG